MAVLLREKLRRFSRENEEEEKEEAESRAGGPWSQSPALQRGGFVTIPSCAAALAACLQPLAHPKTSLGPVQAGSLEVKVDTWEPGARGAEKWPPGALSVKRGSGSGRSTVGWTGGMGVKGGGAGKTRPRLRRDSGEGEALC